jgi:hypothetical protein
MAPARHQLIDRNRLLEEFGMLTEATVAQLLNIDVKTLKNRPLAEQPSFSKVGRARLYHRKAVIAYLEANTVSNPAQPKPKRRKVRAVDERRAAP